MHDHDYQPDAEMDAELDALLDEALSPDRVPGGVDSGMNARILAALPLAQLQSKAAAQPAVIGRIGFFASITVRRFAAALLVVMGIGAMILGLGALQNAKLTSQREAQELAARNAAAQLAIATLTRDIEQAPLTVTAARDLHNTTFSTTESTLDRSIDTLKARTDHASLTAAVDNWSSVAQSLEAELDALESDGNKG